MQWCSNRSSLENGKITEREVEMPPEAYTSGKLTLAIEKISGPNAVVSEIEVFSTDPAQLGAIPLPEPALPVLTPRPLAAPLELGGTWKFSPSAPAGFEKDAAHDDWADIQVPGEWVMQGFKVQPNTPAAYFRTFTLSSKPAGQRFKLRFSAVYSLCRVWLNGIEVGGHEGGFVPFEFDVTDAIKAGPNSLAVSVQSESLMDKLSCGSQYACHPLGRHQPQGATLQRAGSPRFRPQNRDLVRPDISRRHAHREARDSQPVGSHFFRVGDRDDSSRGELGQGGCRSRHGQVGRLGPRQNLEQDRDVLPSRIPQSGITNIRASTSW